MYEDGGLVDVQSKNGEEKGAPFIAVALFSTGVS